MESIYTSYLSEFIKLDNTKMFLITFLVILITYLTLKLVFRLVCYKFKFKIKFKFNNLYELANILIVTQDQTEINIGKLWLTSCYLNRSVNDRIMLCVHDIHVNLSNDDVKLRNGTRTAKFNFLNLIINLLGYGSINLHNLNIHLTNLDLKLNVNKLILNKKVKKTLYQIDMFDTQVHYEKLNANLTISKTSFNLNMSSIGKQCNVNIKQPVLHIKNFNSIHLNEFISKNNNDNSSSVSSFMLIMNQIAKNVKIEKFKFILFSDQDKEESMCGDLNYSDQMNQCEILLSNIDYFKLKKFDLDNGISTNNSIFSYKLMKKFIIKYENRRISVESNDSNLYINMNYLKKLKNLLDDLKFSDHNENSENETIKKCLEFEINMKNFYINLIDLNSNIYTIGAKQIDFNLYNQKNLNLYLAKFLIFKSTLTSSNCTKNKNQNNKYTNNLFKFENTNSKSKISSKDKNSQDQLQSDGSKNIKCLIEKLNLINQIKDKLNDDENGFIHYWGCLLNVNMLSLNHFNQNLSIEIDNVFIEHSAVNLNELTQMLNHLELTNQKDTNQQQELRQKEFISQFKTIKLKVKSINFYFLFKEIYLIYFNFNRFNLRLNDQHKVSFKLNSVNCIEYDLNDTNINEDDRIQSNLSIEENKLNSNKQFYIIKYYKEDVNLIDSNFSLILLFKSIEMANIKCINDFYITMNDMLITWSFRLHYIMNEELLKPFSQLFNRFNRKSNSNSNFKLNFLIESNILVNFLYDYEKDSSKIVSQPLKQDSKVIYFNTSNQNSHNINTLSIILNNFYMCYDNQQKYFSLNVDDITMFINVDDQNICSMLFSRHDDGNENEMADENSSPNKRKVFHAKKFNFVYLGEESNQPNLLKYERDLLECKQNHNRSIMVKFELFSINFLFNYDFAKLFDHWLNLRKCLIQMHNLTKTVDDNNKISPDLAINIKKFQLIIEDDPFEVKLAYNYALMVDEHFESIKRHQTLEQRRLFKEKNLEQEALEILKEKESLIYLKRSKMIYSNNSKSIRTQLFCFQIDSLDLYALADVDWHGRQKCYDILRQIDSHNREPPNNNPAECYSILWCRHININFNDFQFLFRDYTQPLLKMNKFNMFGKLLGSEYQPHERSKRDVQIGVHDWYTFQIQRSMSPFKLYHDLCSKMSLFSFAYGPCWEGCMAQLNLSLDKIIHPPRDPSRPMPWWDKSRLYLHGRLTSLMQQTQIIYHVSMDPYNHTEEMKLVWTNLYFDWKPTEFVFKGGLDIFLNTESKYDDCCLLHLSNLEMKIKIEWLCKKTTSQLCNANICGQHNYVMPCAPDKIPVIVNSHEHDSYSLFRSENLIVSLSFICDMENQSKDNMLDLFPTTISNQEQQQIPPRLKFYASTSRFLQRIKNLLSAITRPTKRGPLFQNFKPRKPILSRHFKLVNINIDIPKLNIVYWSSANEEYGAQIECNHFKMNSTHKLDLIPFQDKLKRRPRPNWSVNLMKCQLDNINLFLMSPTSSSKSNEEHQQQQSQNKKPNIDLTSLNQAEYDLYMLNLTSDYVSIKFLDSQQASKNFFMQIDSIYYERDSNNSCEFSKKFNSNNNSFKSKVNKEPSARTIDENEIDKEEPLSRSYRPKHNLLVKNLKAKWNNINRDVLFNLYEIYNKSKRFRHNISSQALKECDIFTRNSINYSDYLQTHYQKLMNNSNTNFNYNNLNQNSNNNNNHTNLTNLYHKILTNNSDEDYFQALLNKLDMERLNKETSEIYCDDAQNLDSQAMNSNYNNDLLYGYHAANNMNDILSENVFIEFVNSQIKLSLDESTNTNSSTNLNNPKPPQSQSTTKSKFSLPSGNSDSSFDDIAGGYLIISAAKTNVIQRIHKPVWKAQRLLDKMSWSGYLENMQYFATLNSNSNNSNGNTNSGTFHRVVDSNIDDYWLSDDLIDSSSNSLGMLIGYENSTVANAAKTKNVNLNTTNANIR